jgi:hypothetical protein
LKLYARMNLPSFVAFAKANEKLAGRMLYGSFCDHGPRPGRSLRPSDSASGKVPVLVLELNHPHRRRLRVPPAYCQIICSPSAFSRASRGCENYGLSGRTEARSGLRMMPPFPPSPLKFRTAGFPRYGFKAGLSDKAFPALWFAIVLRALRCTGTPCSVSGSMRL